MNSRAVFHALSLLPLLLVACGEAPVDEMVPAPAAGREGGSPPAGPAEVAFEIDDISDPEDQWTTGMARREYGPRGTATLVDARAARNEGFDRLVLGFGTDSVPTYQVEYIAGPAIQCGSGDPVSVEGEGVLMVRLEGADAHDEQGRATLRDRTLRPNLPVIREARLICDFEGHVDWALGVTARTAFRILELSAPTRLAIDVKHAP